MMPAILYIQVSLCFWYSWRFQVRQKLIQDSSITFLFPIFFSHIVLSFTALPPRDIPSNGLLFHHYFSLLPLLLRYIILVYSCKSERETIHGMVCIHSRVSTLSSNKREYLECSATTSFVRPAYLVSYIFLSSVERTYVSQIFVISLKYVRFHS